ncbi:MAG: hypothetical protein NZ522_06380, partial [Chitinophagales bacterium]|nr:hypothetical protein [Chitinophagales bacterium]
MKWKTLLCVFVASYFQVQCQTELPIWSFNPVEKAFKHLLLNNATIALNDTIHEEITDLVQVNITKSILPRRREHHQVFLLGWMAHAFGGFNWRALHSEKQKFVGTISNFKTSHKEKFTEYDIIFDIIFYQKKYLPKI